MRFFSILFFVLMSSLLCSSSISSYFTLNLERHAPVERNSSFFVRPWGSDIVFVTQRPVILMSTVRIEPVSQSASRS
jgi:hypothetical protein